MRVAGTLQNTSATGFAHAGDAGDTDDTDDADDAGDADHEGLMGS